jgi:hypothetical protein
MKNRKKDYIPILTIVKVFVMFAFIWVLKLNIDGLLNLLLIISAIEIVATNYRKSVIKWILMLIELYSIILYIPLVIMKNPLTMFNGLVYMLIVTIVIIIDFSAYIEKI